MILGLIIGLLVSLITIPPIVRVSNKKKLGSDPNQRTVHKGSVPPLGGVAIFAAVIIGTFFCVDSVGLNELRYILVGILMVFLIGLKDDLVNVSWKKKVLVELVAAVIVVGFADLRISSFHGILGIWELHYSSSIAFTIFVFIALMNCFNLLDGIDGLASGMGIVVSLIFGIWLFDLGYWNFAILSFAVTGGLVTFYLFNVFGRKYKIFMGDTGSLLLGFIFTVLAIKVLSCDVPKYDRLYMESIPTVVMGLMIIPILDTVRVFTLRLLKGKSPFSADKTHLHHILLKLGFSHWKASSMIILINLSLFGMSLLMRNMNPMVSTAILFVMALIIMVIPNYRLRQKEYAIDKGAKVNTA